MVSPAIITNELQFVRTVPLLGTTRPVFVGGATKGPVGTPTLVTSESDLVRQFGIPVEADYGLLAAVEYFKEGSQAYYLRVAGASVATAATEVLGPEGVAATGSIALTGLPIDGDSVTISDGTTALIFEFDIATAATGTLDFTGLPADGETFTLDDGANTATVFEYDVAAAATGELILAGQPDDGDQWTVGDGTQSVIFEFDNDSSVVETNTLRQVVIGASLNDTLTNLLNAVNNGGFPFNITAGNLQADRIDLTHDALGVIGNVGIVETTNGSGNLSSTGMAGGDDLVGAGANVPIQIGADAAETVTNTIAAINGVGASLAITAAPGTGDQVALSNDTTGTAGNVAIVESVTNMTATGMAGGADSGVSGNVAVAVGATAAATITNLIAAVNAQSGFDVTASPGANTTTANLSNTIANGATGNVGITESDTNSVITPNGMAGGSASGSTVGLTVSARDPGTGGNDIRVTLAPTLVTGAPAGNFDITVEAPVDTSGALQVVETFFNLSANSADARFAETVVNDGIVNEVNQSRYIRVSVAVNQTPISATYQLGATTAGADGINDITDNDIIGTFAGSAATGIQTLRNKETVQFNVLAIPGNSNSAVLTAAQAIVEFRTDAIYLPDPPFGLTVQQVTDWHNGISAIVPNPPTQALDSDFMALYWPWIQTTSSYLRKSVWLPPSGALTAVYARTDQQVGPWRAPAGAQRGVIDADTIEVSPFQEERDILLGGSNTVNPLVLSGGDIVVFGNETMTRTPQPTDAVHVRRMLIDLKERVLDVVRDIQFEPNDPDTWRNVEQKVQPVLDFIVANRGLQPGAVVKCDADTNPPELQAQKTINAKLFLRHVDAAEIIVIDFVLEASGVGTFQ